MRKRTKEEMLGAYILSAVVAYVILQAGLIDYPLWIMVAVCILFLKDLGDVFIRRTMMAFGHPWFEHFPFVALIAYYGLLAHYSFDPYQWVAVLALIDAAVDFSQDLVSVKWK